MPANIGPWKDSHVVFFAYTHDISSNVNTALQVTHKTYNLKGTDEGTGSTYSGAFA